jgi:hypothetical protein
MGVPISLSELKLAHASFELHDITKKNKGFIAWQNHSKKIPGSFKTIVHIIDGSLTLDNTIIVSDYAGDIALELVEDSNQKLCPTAHVTTHARIHTPLLPTFPLTVKGHWHDANGSLVIKSPDEKTFVCKASATRDDSAITLDSSVHVDPNLLSACACIATGFNLPHLQGNIELRAHNTISGAGITGLAHVHLEDFAADKKPLFNKLDASVHIEQKMVNGYCNIHIENQQSLDATIFYNHEQQNGMLGIHTKEPLCIGSVNLPACSAQCSYDGANSIVHGNFSVHAATVQEQPLAHGTYEINEQTVTINGCHKTARFGASFCPKPFKLCSVHYTHMQTNQPLLEVKSLSDNPHAFNSMIDISLIKECIKAPFAHTIQADGKLILDAEIKDNVVRGSCHLSQGNIRLPQTYNFISGLHVPFSVDLNQLTCSISDAHCTLHKGSVHCKKGTVMFDKNYQVHFAHMPILFDSCLLNPTKDLFAIVSGSSLFSYQQNKIPFLQCNVIIERSQLKENLFSPLFQRALFGPGTGTPPHVACDITVQTRDPIRIKTAFLEANAKVNVNMSNTLATPHLSGSVQIDSGTLSFPYKPLYINKAEITLQPDKLDDPIIELLAKNTIKKHQVTLSVSGSLQNHTISLESSPALTEDQIMALLLVGSPSESLNIVMPALVMQNIKNIIFESEQSPLKLDTYFRHMLRPLKHIHLAPSFIDQTARGGVRGGIEIEIGDRWRALIQKNFSLSEDTRFELEYLVSDDVSIRAIRDERRDASAEAEFRWKF